jgi:hypothetical protein
METTIQQPASGIFTIAVWINFPTGYSGDGIIQLKTKTSGGYVQRDKWLSVGICGPAPNALFFSLWPGYPVNVWSQTTVADGRWRHAVATLSPAGMKLYLDGELIATNSNTGTEGYAGYWVFGGNLGKSTMIDEVRIYDRALSSIEVAQLYALEAAKSKWAWSQIQSPINVPTNFYPGRSAVDYQRGLIYSARKEVGQPGSLIVYNMASNTFTTLPASGWPYEIRAESYVFDSANNRILAWRDSRDAVYAIPAAGGTWQPIGGGASGEDYGNNKWWNPVSGKINTFAGYGFMRFHNWEWEFDTNINDWRQLAANNPGAAGIPWPRFSAWGQSFDPANKRLFLYAGHGNSSGNQYQLDSGIPSWNSDGDLLQDLWMLDLNNRQWTELISVTNAPWPGSGGGIVYYPPDDSVYQVCSAIAPAASGLVTNLVMRYGLADGSTKFSNVETIGTPPPITPNTGWPMPFYNAASSNIICFMPYGFANGEPTGVYALNPIYAEPLITTQPQDQLVHAHGTVSFSVTATGTDPLAYQWTFNGTNLLNTTNSTLNITNVRPWNLGSYTVVVTNYSGSVTSEVAQLTMHPFIATPFSGFTTYWGQTNILSVGAWGSGLLDYQWFFNGVAIPNATGATFILPAIQFTNAGLYSVVVSSPWGSVTNTPYQVVVNPANVVIRICPDVMIEGTVGYSYLIESTTDLSNTNSWMTETNFILTQPIQHWNDNNTDINHPNNPRKFYRVLPGQ